MVIRPRPAGVPFGRYLIRRKLGRGGMGEVFLADQLGPLGPVRPVALKRMLPGLAADPETARLFLEEMGIAAQLNHPNIATTYDFGEIEGDYFLAMEFVEGLSLNRILEALGPLPAPCALEIAKQVADALAYAHAKPVVHQDVSPHNVMISREGSVKLLDFGIARAEAAVHGERVRGKATYAAPEQLRGAAPDRRFDLWSLGVVLYESLTGRPPFQGSDLAVVLDQAGRRDHPRLSTLRPEAEPFEELIVRALEPDPDRRWSSAEAFRIACLRLGERFGTARPADLALLVQRAGGPDLRDDGSEVAGTGVAAVEPKEQEPTAEPAPARTPRRPIALAAVLVIGLLTGLLFAMLHLLRDPPEPSGVDPAAVPVLVQAERAASEGERRREGRASPGPGPAVRDEPIAASATDAPAAEQAVPDAGVSPRRAKPPKKPKRTKRTTPPVVAGSGFGKLSVRTDPTWARLLLNGQPIGRTILYGRPLDPGTHRLQMLPGDDGFAALDATITIKPGVTTNVFANFQTREVRVVER